MKKLSFAVLLGALSLSACAQDGAAPAATAAKPGAQSGAAAAAGGKSFAAGTPQGRAQEALRKVNPQIVVDDIKAAPIAGFQQAIVGGQVVYVSDDGKYLFQGKLFDIDQRRDLTDAAMDGVRAGLLAQVPASDRIVFAPPNPKYTVVVFTDVECGYCRKLHSEIGELNRLGIAVEYLAFPRMGPASPDFRKMESVWCADDRRKALTDAKNDRPVAEKRCKNPVAQHYALGQRAGLTGTPMILAKDGTQIAGYLPPAQLLAAMERHAAAVAAAAAGPAKAATGG